MKRSRINSSTISLLVPANFCRAIFLIKKFRFEWKTTKVFCPTLVPHPRLLLPEKIIEKHFWLIKQLLPSPVGEKGKRQSFPFFISPSTSFPSHGKGGFSRITRLVQQLIWFGWESVKLVFPLHFGCFFVFAFDSQPLCCQLYDTTLDRCCGVKGRLRTDSKTV